MAGFLAGGLASPAMAQVSLPGSAEAGRNDAIILRQPLKPLSGTGAATTRADAKIEAPQTGVKFVLKGVKVSGSTVFEPADFDAVFADQIGQKIEVGEVFAIAKRLTALYRSKGYILSQVIVPPQEITGGVVRLKAVEGYVDNVVIDGALGSRRGLVAEMGDKIMASRPLKSNVLERYLLLAGDLAGLKVEGIFSPSADQTGAATLTIKSRYDWVEGSFAVLNHGSDAVGPGLVEAQATFNSVLGMHERITVKGGLALEPSELQTGEIQLSLPISAEGTNAYARLALSGSKPGNGLQTFGTESRSTRWSVGVRHPFIRSRQQNLFGDVRFDWDDLFSQTASYGTLSDDHLRVVRGTINYDFVDTALGADKPAVTALSATLSQGLDIFGASTAANVYPSRTNADGTFTTITAEFQRQQSLGGGFGLLVAAKGQLAAEPLLASEEFGFGGTDYGRGYDPSALTGDRGLAGKIELQYNGEAETMAQWLDAYQLYAFVDLGLVENINFDGLGNNQTQSAWSTGAGVRLDLVHNVNMDLALAYRGTPTPSVNTFGIDRFRLLGKLEAQF